MTIQAKNLAIDELQNVIVELETLTSKPTQLTGRESQRHSFLLAKMAMLRSGGVSVNELRHAEHERMLKEANLPPAAMLRGDKKANEEFRNFILTGESRGSEFPPEFRSDNIAGGQSISYTQGTAGSYYVPIGYHSDVVLPSLTQHDQILDPRYSNQFDTLTGQPLSQPVVDDFVSTTPNKSVIVGETAQSSQIDAVAGVVQFPTAATFRSGRLFVSMELVQDSGPVLSDALLTIINRRHAIGVGAKFINGSGSGVNPEGLITNLPSGTITTSAATSLTLADFEAVYTSLDLAYSDRVWYMSQSTMNLVTKLLETSGRPMIGDVPELLRVPIAVCNTMATVSAGTAAVAVLADRRYISQRFVPRATAIKRFEQASGYIEAGLIGIEGYVRCSQRILLTDAAVPPVASLTVHS